MPDPDEFDQQLRDLTSGQAEPAKFTELSAAERLRRVPSPPQPPQRMKWRKARKARQLRKPVPEPGRAIRPEKRRRQPTPASTRKGRQLAITKVVGVVVVFAALLYGLHLLGFGPR